MFYVALVLFALLMATWFGKPAARPPTPTTSATLWRVTMKGGQTVDIEAETEGLATREVLKRGMRLDKIVSMERVP